MDEKILMPKSLTFENGAKYALNGEFSESITLRCPECDDDDDDDDGNIECEICEGAIYYKQPVTVKWTTIKEIYKKAVELLGREQGGRDGQI